MRIQVDDITIQAAGRELFAHTTWTLLPGQTWAILGPTGAGKSALAAAISRRLPLSHGKIRYLNERSGASDPASLTEGRSYLHPGELQTFSAETHRAYVQRFAGYVQARWQSLEGDENPIVADYLMTTRITGPETGPFPPSPAPTLDGLVRLLSLEPLLDRQIHRLSNGESRKVFLAHLLLSAPSLLILDDPFNGLDTAARLALSAAIDALIERAYPKILLITSRTEDLPGGITHILGVRDGQVFFQGPKEGLKKSNRLETLFSSPAPPQPDLDSKPEIIHINHPSKAIQHYAAELVSKITQYPPELIEMQNVTVAYDQVRVLQQVTWTVRQGERWLVSGPNGAGKTSLLSLVLADNPQSYANPVTLFGKRRGSGESIWGVKRAIGWVSPELQSFYARASLDHAPLTCLQVICSGFFDSVGLFHAVSPAQKAAAAGWLVELGLESLSGQPFHRLSSGQQRLALLARALVKSPPLLVLDEPCQALDAGHRQAFTRLIDALCAAAPLTLLYVTHDPAEYPASITHRLRLELGQIVESGKIDPT